MIIPLLEETLLELPNIRNRAKISSTNIIRSSMIRDMYICSQEYLNDQNEDAIHQKIIENNIIGKKSYHNKVNSWLIFKNRYLMNPPEVMRNYAISSNQGVSSSEYLSLSYLFFALTDSLAYTIITDLIWEKWQNHDVIITSIEITQFLDKILDKYPAIRTWSLSTRKRVCQSLLAGLRDYGVLTGKTRKSIQWPAISLEAAYLLLCILYAEGKRGNQIIISKDWHLFLWSEHDVIDACQNLAHHGLIRFERSGKTTMLDLILRKD